MINDQLFTFGSISYIFQCFVCLFLVVGAGPKKSPVKAAVTLFLIPWGGRNVQLHLNAVHEIHGEESDQDPRGGDG